jgi:cytochrome c biogenesis protein CcdA
MSAALLTLGLFQGFRHAFEPDHMSAVAALSSRKLSESLRFALLWALGHSVTLFVVSMALLALRSQMPAKLTLCAEVCGALCIIGLGARALWGSRRAAPSTPTMDDAAAHERHQATLMPLAVGFVHGFAGSGAVAALALSHASRSLGSSLAFIGIYSLGVVLAMSGAAAALGKLARTLLETHEARRTVACFTGVLSIAVGIVWILQV